jgi:hypothetical protein
MASWGWIKIGSKQNPWKKTKTQRELCEKTKIDK